MKRNKRALTSKNFHDAWNVLSSIYTRFAAAQDFKAAVNFSLNAVGKLCGASRCYIFLLDRETGKNVIHTYEWCDEGVSSQMGNFQQIPIADFPWIFGKLAEGKPLFIEDVSQLPSEAAFEKRILEKEEVKAIAAFPLFLDNNLFGYLGFHNVWSTGNWSQESITVMSVFSELIGALISSKASIDAFQDAKARFDDISSNINDWLWEVDTSGCYTYSNDAVEKILGYSANEVIGKYFYDFFLPEEKEQLKEISLKAFSSKLHFKGFVNCNVHKNGSIIYLETSGVPILDEKGNLVGYRGADCDITERKKAEQALNASEEKYRKMFEHSLDAIFMADAETGILVDCNSAAAKLVGRDKSGLIGQHYSILHPKGVGKDFFTKKFIEKICDGNTFFDTQVITEKGEIKQVSIRSSIIELRNKRLIQGIFRDVTSQKKAEFALKQEHAMLESVTSSMGAELNLIDKDYRILWNNKLMQQTLNLEENSKKCFERLHGRSSICPDCGVKKVLEGAEYVEREFCELDKNGNMITAQIMVTPVKDEHGHVIAGLELTFPTTQRKMMELKLAEASKLYHALFEQAPLGVVVIDPATTKVIEFNDMAHNQLGYTRDEFSKLAIKDFEAMENVAAIRARINKILWQGHDAFETRHRTKTGEIRNVLVNVQVAEVSGRKILLNTYHDITGIKKMQNAIRENEEKFHGIAHSVKDAIVLIDDQAKVTYWNPAAEKTFGYSSKEAIGKDIHSLVVPKTLSKEGKASIEIGLKAFNETGAGYFTAGSVQIMGARKDGSEFPAQLAISPIKLHGRWNAVGVVRDITEIKQAEQKLREAEQRYHALFHQSPLGVLLVDPETKEFLEFNDTAPLQLGYTREEFESISLYDIEYKESPLEVDTHVSELVKAGGGEFETQHITKNGDLRDILVSAKTIELANKRYLHAIFHDITQIRTIQNALAESESRYRQLVELAQEGIWAIDTNYTTMFVNPHMAQMLGYIPSEMLGKTLFEFLRPQSVKIVRQILEPYNKKSMKGQFEYAFPTKTGGSVTISIAVSTMTDDQGVIIGTLAVMSDVTKSRQLENDLRASEERFRAISTSAMDAIILVDYQDTVLYWNPAAERIFGYTENEAVGHKLVDLVVPTIGREKHALLIKRVEEQAVSNEHFDYSAQRKDGTIFPIEMSISSIKLANKTCMLSIVRDITERKSMEDALKQERDMLENMATNISAGLTIIGKDYRILWANQLLKQISGNSNLENRFCYSIYNKSSGVCSGCGVKKVFENGKQVERHDYHFVKGDRDRWIELIASPIKDKEGKIVAALELAVDITERKRLQNKLAEYSQHLEELVQKRTGELKRTQAELVKSERLAAIGELAGMVGHDLRNPLTGIKNSAYFLKKKGKDIPSEQNREILEIIDRCVDYSNKIVNDLLDYSREPTLAFDEQSLRKLLNECLAITNKPENVQVKVNVDENSRVMVDADKINRVFINLIKNAFDAMPNGGTLTISSQIVGTTLEISFSDTGHGIPQEALPKIFTPLFTTKAQGMGFGLAICKRLIEAHGGSIMVETVKGKGTTFTVKLPLGRNQEVGGEKVWVNMPESSLLTTTKP